MTQNFVPSSTRHQWGAAAPEAASSPSVAVAADQWGAAEPEAATSPSVAVAADPQGTCPCCGMNGATLSRTMNRDALAVAIRVSRDLSGHLHESKVGNIFRICHSCYTAKMAAIKRARSDHPNCSDFTSAKGRGKQAAVLTHCIKAGSLSLVRYFVDPHLKHPDLFFDDGNHDFVTIRITPFRHS